jgi:hypothetical protein
VLEALAQDRDDLGPRPVVDEDDEAKPEPLLVGLVQPGQDLQKRGVGLAPLLARGAPRELRFADPRVGVERLDPVRLGELLEDRTRLTERVLSLGEDPDEPSRALEELAELLHGQLPR